MARCDLTPNPDPGTLWIEDFDPFETNADSRGGWYAFEPEEISAEQAGSTVRFREVSEYAGGSIQRILPLGDAAYRYLQIRITKVENPSHYFKAWLRLPGHGHPQLGRVPRGLGTIDLSAFPFFGEIREMALNLAVIGPTGRTPSGGVEVDWVRLVRKPFGGLTARLIEADNANGSAEIGDSLEFSYTADQPVTEAVRVTCHLAENETPVRLAELDHVDLADDGRNGDAAAGDGTFTGRVTITPEAAELSTGKGTVTATTEVAGEPRSVSLPFAFDILPAAWRAAAAARGVAVGDELFREDFAVSEAHDWRAYDSGWSVHRPREGTQETSGLRNATYDRPRPNGRWIALPVAPQQNASLSAGLRPLGGSGPSMLALRFQDPDNHYRLRIVSTGEIRIERVRAGWQESLAVTKRPSNTIAAGDRGAPVATFTVAGPVLIASIDGQPVLHAYDNTFTEGSAALGLNRLIGQFENVVLRTAALTQPPAGFAWPKVRLALALRDHDKIFDRDAGTVRIPVRIANASTRKLAPMSVDASLISRSIHTHPFAEVSIPELAAQTSTTITIPLQAHRFRSGSYWLVVRLCSGDATVATDAARLVVCKPIPAERMDVFWWGGANIAEQIRDVAEAGVTVMHEFGRRSPELWELGCRLGLSYYSYPPALNAAPAAIRDAFENPKAGGHAVRVDELDPAFREWAIQTAQSHARAWRANRRLRYVLLNSEYETRTYPNLSAAAEARYEKRLGFARPKEADVPYHCFSPATSLARFPTRIVPDDAPLYKWFRFFYADGGGGLNEITCSQAQAIAKIAPRIVTLHDPVLRAPQFHGRWEGMKLLNHWTYVEQNPLDVAAFADEMVCLGRRSGWKQQISQMVQIIAYRKSAMPENQDQAPNYLEDAPFVAIPPGILSEAMWLVMSRPIDMVAFHGLKTAVETQEKQTYRYTNPGTLAALQRVSRELIQPYGPALKRIKAQPGPRVALLLSAANTIFGRIAEGGGTRTLHNPLTAGRFPVDVLYDEDVQDGALENYAVLAIPQCRFLLRSVQREIAEFQRGGGTILLDPDAKLSFPDALRLPQASSGQTAGRKLELVPGEVLELPSSSRARLDADLRLVAAALREQLLPRLNAGLTVDSPHPYVVLDARRSGELTYVFAINDQRTVGPYLGPYGSVLEQGVPITAAITFRDPPGALYDALEKRQLSLAQAADQAGGTVEVAIEGAWGKLLVAGAEAFGDTELSVSDRTEDDELVTIRAQARYVSGRSVKGVVPLRFDVLSPDSELNDCSRFTATAEDGSWTTRFPIARNEPPGIWTARLTELISGRVTTGQFRVTALPVAELVTRTAPAVDMVTIWHFDNEAEIRNRSGETPHLTLRGESRFVTQGKLGGCLECFVSVKDSKQGVDAGKRPEWCPKGPFAVELWIKPKPEMADAKSSFLMDCNYYLRTADQPRANAGYALFLSRGTEGLQPTVVLGFGDRTATVKARVVDLQAGTWYRLGFSYDGAGTAKITLDGKRIGGGTVAGAGALATPKNPLIIGGRVGSSHYGCAAYIDEVKLTLRASASRGNQL